MTRTDLPSQNRLDDFYVFVSDVPFVSGDLAATLAQSGVWSQHLVGVPDPKVMLTVGRSGRYVRIQLGDTNYLSLAEVKVFAPATVPSGDNVALGKAASQSSTYGTAGRAVDDSSPGASDSLAIAVYDSSGDLLFSSEWDGVQTLEKLLCGGNVVIHDADALKVSVGGPLPGQNTVSHLSQSDLEASVPTAVELWRDAGVDQSILNGLRSIDRIETPGVLRDSAIIRRKYFRPSSIKPRQRVLSHFTSKRCCQNNRKSLSVV